MRVNLGELVEDVLTGFRGRVYGLVHYMTGCHQALVIPWVDRDGKKGDPHWIDLDRCKVVGPGLDLPGHDDVSPEGKSPAVAGGPMRDLEPPTR